MQVQSRILHRLLKEAEPRRFTALLFKLYYLILLESSLILTKMRGRSTKSAKSTYIVTASCPPISMSTTPVAPNIIAGVIHCCRGGT